MIILDSLDSFLRLEILFQLSWCDFRSCDALIDRFNTVLTEVKESSSSMVSSIKLAVLDHITSNTAIALPIARLIRVLRSHASQCIVLIDGAHGPGQVYDLNLSKLAAQGVDYYAGRQSSQV